MWEKWVNWRIEYRADFINEGEIINELRTGKAFYYGYDKLNNPILIIKIKNHFPK